MTAKELINNLQLLPHPEGGWYRETYRSPLKLQTLKGERNLATLIYYLLPAGVESRGTSIDAAGPDSMRTWPRFGPSPAPLASWEPSSWPSGARAAR